MSDVNFRVTVFGLLNNRKGKKRLLKLYTYMQELLILKTMLI